MIRPGDFIGTTGRGGLYEPLYARIRAYSRRKYRPTDWNPTPTTTVTHVRIAVSSRRFFEMTFPLGRFRSFRDDKLAEKFDAGTVRVVRFPSASIDPVRLLDRCRQWDGKPYDVTDLINFELSAILGIYARIVNVLGVDRMKRFSVCSPCAMDILSHAVGKPFPFSIDGVDPNGPFNKFDSHPDDYTGAWWNPIEVTHLLTRESFQ